jgi:integrase/recombinase XerD
MYGKINTTRGLIHQTLRVNMAVTAFNSIKWPDMVGIKSADSDISSKLNQVKDIWSENRCLKPSSICRYVDWIYRFYNYCIEEALVPDVQLTHVGVATFSLWYAQRQNINPVLAHKSAHSALRAWSLGLIATGGLLPSWHADKDNHSAQTPCLPEFADYLRQHRGSPEVTIKKKLAHITHFLEFLNVSDKQVDCLILSDIDNFIVEGCKHYARTTTAGIGCSLRSYLRFLLATGQILNDLSASVVTPIIRCNERPLRSLPWDDVCRILAAIDCNTIVGQRDHAMRLLMSTYGLGAGEVIRLTLDDIDWRAGILSVVRPKTGVAFTLPLLPAVAQSLSDYLHKGRPQHVPSRCLFVSMRAPHLALSSSSAIRHILISHANTAGVTAEYLGSHVLRHTHACRQIELGTNPQVLSDILGHCTPTAISAYINIATEQLRQLPLPVPI